MEETIVILDDNRNVHSAYVCANHDVLRAFLVILGFIGIDKYYLMPHMKEPA
jgi:hypothetical protein